MWVRGRWRRPNLAAGKSAARTASPRRRSRCWKWTAADFDGAKDGRAADGQGLTDQNGRSAHFEAGFKAADIVIDETHVTPNTNGTQPPNRGRRWANGRTAKLYLHGSTQSVAQTVPSLARWVGIPADKVVVISEFTGGGFGEQIPRRHLDGHPGAAVEEGRRARHDVHHARGGALHRPGAAGDPRAGEASASARTAELPRRPGRGCGQRRVRRAGRRDAAAAIVSLAYQPDDDALDAADGDHQLPPSTSAACARRGSGDRHHRADHHDGRTRCSASTRSNDGINAAVGKASLGRAAANGKQTDVTSAFVRPAIHQGAELFKWEERGDGQWQAPGHEGTRDRRGGEPVRRGPIGFDGLFVIKPTAGWTSSRASEITAPIGSTTWTAWRPHMGDCPATGATVTWGHTEEPPVACDPAGSETAHAMTRAASRREGRQRRSCRRWPRRSSAATGHYTLVDERTSGAARA